MVVETTKINACKVDYKKDNLNSNVAAVKRYLQFKSFGNSLISTFIIIF
jgi:hypothetical protein